MRVISVDPGRMSGFCYADITDERMNYHPFQDVDDVEKFWDRLEQFKPRFVIIEDFEFRRGKRSAAGLDLFPVQLIGVASLYALKASHQCALYIQKAAQGKAYYTDNILKSLGLYKRGIPHGMDASRHLLQWCTFGAGNRYMGTQQTKDFAHIVDKDVILMKSIIDKIDAGRTT